MPNIEAEIKIPRWFAYLIFMECPFKVDDYETEIHILEQMYAELKGWTK